MTTATAKPKKTFVQWDRSQHRFVMDESRVQVVCWHRQKGKDFTTAAKACMDAMETGQAWYIVSLTQRQADETFAKCLHFQKDIKAIHKIKIAEKSSSYDVMERDPDLDRDYRWTAHELHFPTGGKVVSLPGRDPNTLAGFTGNVILTEFGLFPKGGYDHWGVLFPIITRGNFKLIVISTPRGKNTKFYELVNDRDTYSVHFCDIYQSVYEEGYQLFDKDGKPFPSKTRADQEQAIAGFRRMYNDESKWSREYECKFTGDLEALIRYAQLEAASNAGRGLPFDWIRIDGDNASAKGWTPAWFEREDVKAGRLEIGWDVARTSHLSALWCNHVLPGKPKHLRFLVLMHDTSFELQRQVVRAAMRARGGGNVGAGDATGMGMDSNETLAAEFGQRWLPFSFAGNGKGELGSIGRTAFDSAGVSIPPLDGEAGFVGMDLAAIQADTSSGKVKLDEGENPLMRESHCDIAYAGLLALKAGGLASATPRARWL